ncbi:hypothetical protein EYF80_019470 [Liparis tanakae]|uniref:Uncharacterized protein n=1 Tax=Liparis tanakae TaxID=230148 RepID=A0A4Z2HWM4_9TELE|nr:hypothetical protein EYF80_019470 [Liparis tanakae]
MKCGGSEGANRQGNKTNEEESTPVHLLISLDGGAVLVVELLQVLDGRGVEVVELRAKRCCRRESGKLKSQRLQLLVRLLSQDVEGPPVGLLQSVHLLPLLLLQALLQRLAEGGKESRLKKMHLTVRRLLRL